MILFCRLALIGLMLMGLGISLAEHGTPKTGINNFWVALASVIIQILLLWGGGFFS